ncbi:MAG: hypothetical protein HYR73_01810, partial [Candidatus Eisenbacteria bacterium]|nr:hypothetical protein [Candidatus Eisenbacteria bacterium]
MRKSYVALLLLIGAVAVTANAALAQLGGEDNVGMKLMNAQIAQQMHSRAAKLGVSTTNDTVFIGYSTAGAVTNYWKVGKGATKPRPHQSGPAPAFSQTNTDGWWTFENPVNGDSLQGWWPTRSTHANVSGATRVDKNRPWWAIEVGNNANYVINERRDLTDAAAPGNRTYGVVGVWHVDPGNS